MVARHPRGRLRSELWLEPPSAESLGEACGPRRIHRGERAERDLVAASVSARAPTGSPPFHRPFRVRSFAGGRTGKARCAAGFCASKWRRNWPQREAHRRGSEAVGCGPLRRRSWRQRQALGRGSEAVGVGPLRRWCGAQASRCGAQASRCRPWKWFWRQVVLPEAGARPRGIWLGCGSVPERSGHGGACASCGRARCRPDRRAASASVRRRALGGARSKQCWTTRCGAPCPRTSTVVDRRGRAARRRHGAKRCAVPTPAEGRGSDRRAEDAGRSPTGRSRPGRASAASAGRIRQERGTEPLRSAHGYRSAGDSSCTGQVRSAEGRRRGRTPHGGSPWRRLARSRGRCRRRGDPPGRHRGGRPTGRPEAARRRPGARAAARPGDGGLQARRGRRLGRGRPTRRHRCARRRSVPARARRWRSRSGWAAGPPRSHRGSRPERHRAPRRRRRPSGYGRPRRDRGPGT